MRSQCCLTSASLFGVEAIPVTVEVAVGPGLPGISIVGMADTAVQEAKERVRSAVRMAGFSVPTEKIVVNLAPGDLKKTGSGFDLPIALGILAASGQIDPKALEGRLYVGELSLDGHVRQVAGELAYCICASKMGCGFVGAPRKRAPIDNMEQLQLSHLSRLHMEDPLEEVCGGCKGAPEALPSQPDFSDVSGHEVAKRALQIAAAGSHCLLMVGPPGSGKTMLASRLPTILPALSDEEKLEAAAVHSVAGEPVEGILEGARPFRSPHHSATMAGLLGGGNPVRPGEVSLAHCGVLFLDELAEFKASVLQSLRQPVEDGQIVVTRAAGKVCMPSEFMLVGATNPCPCGYFGDRSKDCSCTALQVRKYQSRIGGPLIDRFEMQLDVQRIPSSEVLKAGTGLDSRALRDGVMAGREFASWRQSRERDGGGSKRSRSGKKANSSGRLIESCRLDDEAKGFVVSMSEANELSGRALVGSLRVARTIADMEECEKVGAVHVAEAFGFRMSDYIGGC